MSRTPPNQASETIRDRCRALGLAMWRADTSGKIVEEPGEPGLLGLWLRSAVISGLVSESAGSWAGVSQPEVLEVMPGAWLIPVPEEQRRRRVGMSIALALGPEVLTAERFLAACATARLDLGSLRASLRRLCAYDEGSVFRTAESLKWMLRDLAQLSEYQDAVSGFTNELTDSYETIDLLYGLGRSMLDLDRPEKFVSLLCDRLHETMPFGWVAARFEPTELAVGSLAARLLVRGTPPWDVQMLNSALERFKSQMTPDFRGALINTDGEIVPALGSRVLVQPVVRAENLAGFLIIGDKRGADPQVSSYDIQLLEAAAAFTGAFLENAQLYRDHQHMFMGSLKALTSAIDAKDRYTCGHSERVAMLGAQLARAAGLSEEKVERIHICGLLHDVGKIGVPEAVLCKPGRLTDQEFALIKLHPEIGHRILKDIPKLQDILPGVLYHHERWDGQGYPHGLRGDEIPLFARLLGLADTFDAMSSTRAYRAALPRDVVLAEIQRSGGTQFDPELTKLMLRLDLAEYDRMVARHAQEAMGGQGLSVAA
jgi:HD-GYP domain-containing protein (c-di-GMP phosphodiesterase class II)